MSRLSRITTFRGPLIIEIEKNVATLEDYGQSLQAGTLRIYATSRAHVELPMMRGATKRFSRQAAFTQAAFLMRTSIRICINSVIDIDQQNIFASDFETQHLAAPKIVQ
jgi:hypothetical protein